jgi:hypothetical protein
MADRNAPSSFTLEEWRVEFNELASDVGDITSLPSTVNGQNVTDLVETVVQLESALSSVMFPTVIDFDDSTGIASERILMGTDDDLQLYHDGTKSVVSHTGTGELELTSNSTTLTFPNVGGTIATEGFGIALAIALG